MKLKHGLSLGCGLLVAALVVRSAPASSAMTRAWITSPLSGATTVDLEAHGQVSESVRAGRYTYLRLEGATAWHVLAGSVPPSNHLHLRSYAVRDDFVSPALGRRFARLYFSAASRGGETRR
ncbi:MAG: hypothetical protein AAFU79_31120 [Myxococcota bacterium]